MNGLLRTCSTCHRRIAGNHPYQFFGSLGPEPTYACGSCIKRALSVISMYRRHYKIHDADSVSCLLNMMCEESE
jgi:hypothetical protein